jgi:acetyl esterase
LLKFAVSILSSRLVADPLARLFAAVSPTTPSAALCFPEIVCRTTAASIPTRHGPVAATIYHPPKGSGATPPAYVNVHGGGFVVGHAEQDDPWCRYLAARAKTVVINKDYSLAPRQRFPVAVERIYDVLRWAAAPERDWDGGRLCVGGQSAGGNLSAAAARLALENAGPQLKLQVLHYAPLDLVTRAKDKNARGGRRAVFRPWMGEILDTAYIPDPNKRRDRLASPAWGTNGDEINGIAPALVITAELDRLRDEAASYASKLEAAGSLVAYHDIPGVDHGYNILGDSEHVTRQMYDFIADHVCDATAESGSAL